MVSKYNANDTLEAMAEFLLAIREQYLKEGAKMVLVTHDWGTIIGARLAAEVGQLADRWVLASALIVSFPGPVSMPTATDNDTARACICQHCGQGCVSKADAPYIHTPAHSPLTSQECVPHRDTSPQSIQVLFLHL